MARDRSVNVNVVNTSTHRAKRSDNVQWTTKVDATSRYQVRVPTGGLSKPLREKPFTHVTLIRSNLSGGFFARSSSTSQTLYTGDLGLQSSFAADGKSLRTWMDFPYTNPRVTATANPAINVDLLSQAEVKAYNKLRDETGAADLDFGLWYAERHETVDLFRSGAVGLGQIAQSIARKDFRQTAKVFRDVFGVATSGRKEAARARRVERWLRKELGKVPSLAKRTYATLENAVLTHNLALTPLMQDLAASHQALRTAATPSGMRIKAVSRHQKQFQDKDIEKNGSQFPWVITTQYSGFTGYTVTLIAEPLLTDQAKLQRAGLTNPVGTLYQATTLTFILDYFWAMGQYLSALNVPLGFRFVDGSWSHRDVANVRVTVESPGNNVAKGSWTRNYLKRTVYTKFPVPIPPLSLRGRSLSEVQATNVGLIALKSLRSLVGLKF